MFRYQKEENQLEKLLQSYELLGLARPLLLSKNSGGPHRMKLCKA